MHLARGLSRDVLWVESDPHPGHLQQTHGNPCEGSQPWDPWRGFWASAIRAMDSAMPAACLDVSCACAGDGGGQGQTCAKLGSHQEGSRDPQPRHPRWHGEPSGYRSLVTVTWSDTSCVCPWQQRGSATSSLLLTAAALPGCPQRTPLSTEAFWHCQAPWVPPCVTAPMPASWHVPENLLCFPAGSRRGVCLGVPLQGAAMGRVEGLLGFPTPSARHGAN